MGLGEQLRFDSKENEMSFHFFHQSIFKAGPVCKVEKNLVQFGSRILFDQRDQLVNSVNLDLG